MIDRRLLVGAGLAALAAGAVAVVAPGTLPVQFDRAVLLLVGGLVLVRAGLLALSRYRNERTEAETPDREAAATPPTPGDDLREAVTGFLDADRIGYGRNRLKDGLRAAAVDVLVQYDGRSPDEARDLVADGAWTDDRQVAAFLDGASTQRVRDRALSAVGLASSFGNGVAGAVDAIAVQAGIDGRPADDDPSGGDRGRGRRIGREGEDSTAAERENAVASGARTTGRWYGVSAVAFASVGFGVLVGRPGVLLAGVVGVGFAAYARSFAPEAPDLSVERRLETDRPDPDEAVEVTVTVTNEGDRTLPDVRFVDGVPDALAVASGSPRAGLALRPGESETVSYAVRARRGVHEFEPALAVVRDVAGATERDLALDERTTLTCVPDLPPPAASIRLREPTNPDVGPVETHAGGEGIAFHATRAYRPGDPPSRIDWNRWARGGELATVEFREEHTARVVLLLDAREAARVAPDTDSPPAIDRAVDATAQLYASLVADGNRVGVAAVGATDCWLAPGEGPEHRVAVRDLLATHPALHPVDGAVGGVGWERRFRARLAPGTSVVLVSPLCDDGAAHLARRLDAYGHPVTVLSPDPTARRTPGHRLAAVGRALRVAGLRSAGIPVLDWAPDGPLAVALAEGTR